MNTTTIEFAIWKTVECYGTKLDLVKVSATQLGVTGEVLPQHPQKQDCRYCYNPEDIARSAVNAGLKYAPAEALRVFFQALPTGGTVDEQDAHHAFFILNEYGETITLDWYKGKWHLNGEPRLYGFGDPARFVFVKPRKQERQ